MTWIRSAAQAPYTYARLISNDPSRADRRYWNEEGKPAWPFGHGLSYTRFEYLNLRVERQVYRPQEVVKLRVDIRHVGDRIGDDVAQVYVHQRTGSTSRPVRELKGFLRVRLEPGETRTLDFEIKPEDLTF